MSVHVMHGIYVRAVRYALLHARPCVQTGWQCECVSYVQAEHGKQTVPSNNGQD